MPCLSFLTEVESSFSKTRLYMLDESQSGWRYTACFKTLQGQGTVMSPANPLPVRSASWACDHGPGLRRTWASGSMFNSHCLGIIKNFIFEFVFCKWSLMGQWSMGWAVGGLEPQLTRGAAYCCLPTFLAGVLGSPLPTFWALSPPYFTLLPCYHCHPQPAAGLVSGGRPTFHQRPSPLAGAWA